MKKPLVFKTELRKHWPIIESYKDRLLSRKQAEAQLRDLGCETWEVELYLDGDEGDDE